MPFDTTQLVKDLAEGKQPDLFSGDMENLVPIEQNKEGKWVETPEVPEVQEGTGDLENAIPIDLFNINITTNDEPVLVPQNVTEVPIETELDGSSYWELKLKQGKAPLWYGRIGERHAMGEITLEEAIEYGNRQHIEQLELADRIEILSAQLPWITRAGGGAVSYMPYLVDSTIEAAKGALMFGTGAAVTAILTGGATTPLIPGLIAAGGTYGVIKNTMEVEGMGLYLDLLRKGMNPDIALPLSISAGVAMGIVEVYSLKLFGAGFKRKVVEAVMSQLGKSALVNMTAFWAKSTGIQLGQEAVQESIEIATKFFASIVDDNPDIMPDWEEIQASYEELLTAEGAGGLAALSLPSAVGVGIGTRSANIKKAQAEVNRVIDEKKAKEFKEAGEVEVELGVVSDEVLLQEAVDEIVTKHQNLLAEAEVAGVEAFGIQEAREIDDVIVGGQFSGGEKIPSKPSKPSKPSVTTKTKVSQEGQTTAEKLEEKEKRSVSKLKIKMKRKDIEGRINKLISEKRDINEDIDKIGKEFLKGELTEAQLDRKLETEFNKLIKLDDILVPLQLLEDASSLDLGAVKVELRANEVRALEVAVIKERALALERGLKAGRRIAREEILEIQNAVIAMVMKSEATEAGKRRALKAMRKIQTDKQAVKALPLLREQLEKSTEGLKKSVLINKFKKLTKSKAVHELRPEIKKEVVSILEAFTAVKPSKIKVARIMNALRENESNELSDEQLLHLAGLDRKPLSDLDLEDVQNIHDAVSHLIWINTEINKAIEQERTAEDQQNVEKAVSNLNRKYKNLEGSIEGLDSLQKAEEEKLLGFNLGGVKDIPGVGSYNMELIGEILDGEDNGIIQRIMYREIDKGEARSLKFKHDAEDYFIGNGLREILKDDSWSEFFAKKFKKVKMESFTLDSGKTIKMSKGTRIAFLLHAKNEDSRRHLINGGFVLRRHAFAKVKKMTEDDLSRLVDSATAEEEKVAAILHGYFNLIQKQAINETSVGLLGFEVAIVDNYFPIQVSGQALSKKEQVKNLSDSNDFIKETLEGMGIFKRRVKSDAPIVITDAFEVTHQQVQKVAAYIGLAAPLRKAKALLHAPDFKAALENAGLSKYRQSMEDYIGRVEGDSIRNDSFDRLTQKWINKLDVANLALNIGVMAKQPVSYFLAASEMNVKYIMTSFKPHVSRNLKAEIKKWSPHFRDRFEGNVTREMGEVASVGRTRRFFTGRELMSNKFMVSIKVMDTMAIAGIWRATKKEVAAKNPSLKVGSDEFMQKVADRAWFVARRTQPTFSIKDRSTIGRKQNTFWRLATKYSSQRNKNWMIQRRAFEKWNRSEKTAKDLGSLMARLTLVRAIAPAMIAAINTIRGVARGYDDEEELYKRFLFDWLKVTIGDIYIISGVLQLAIDKATSKGFGFGMTDPLTSSFELVGKFIGDLVKLVTLTTGISDVEDRWEYEKKRDKTVERLFKESLDLGSKITGIPAKSALGSLTDIGSLTGIIDKKEDTGSITTHTY